MNDGIAGRIGALIAMIAALVLALTNVLMKGVPGLAVFAVADFPLSLLLPGFRDDYLPAIGFIFGLFWFLLMAGIIIVALNRNIPERWRKSPLIYRTVFMVLSTVAMSAVLALPFHLYGILMTRLEYGA